MNSIKQRIAIIPSMLAAMLALTALIYWPGLRGGFLFDDYPNIVDNTGIHIHDASLSSITRAALSSPSSEFKRPLSSLTFAANYLLTGLDPFWMKLTNLVLHLVNGLLVFWLTRRLVEATHPGTPRLRCGLAAICVAAGWLLLPINLTAVLYVVQRMESLANLFVLAGLLSYVNGRIQMLDSSGMKSADYRLGLTQSALSIVIAAALGLLAKETAIMLPLYAGAIEWIVFRFAAPQVESVATSDRKLDFRVISLFVVVLVLPLILGLSWMLPGLLRPGTWAIRDFTLGERLLSEARIVTDYIGWTLLPTPSALSFYHDDFSISHGLLAPPSTLAGITALAALAVVVSVPLVRRRYPLVALGLAFFLGCHLLTGTIIPLELIYEHRNYFASFGLILALVPWLCACMDPVPGGTGKFSLPRRAALAGLLILWAGMTAITAQAWSSPLRLAEELAQRAPDSPRAQYELGRTYVIYSRYDPGSPFTPMVYAPLERAMKLPESSILPEQALIFFNARMHRPIDPAWWESLTEKLSRHTPTVQDESSLAALTQCMREGRCDIPTQPMVRAFLAALSHPAPSARLLANYGDFAWNLLQDRSLGVAMTKQAIRAAPGEPAYRITLVRMLAAQGDRRGAEAALRQVAAMNIGGQLDPDLAQLRALPALQTSGSPR